MELKNIKETKNLVFDRKEVEATIISESSPSNKEAAVLISKNCLTCRFLISIWAG